MKTAQEQLDQKLIALQKASLELVSDISIDSLLERIAMVACEQGQAKYSALAVTNDVGKFEKFIVVGMSNDIISKIDHHPEGLGLLRETFVTGKPVRVVNIGKDPRSIGFPANHPGMRSFLGVPILIGEKAVGQLYLAEKIDGPEFTDEDEKTILTLASYAAVAINNANYVEELQAKDLVLTRQTQDLALLNNIGESLTTSTEPEQVLQNTLSLVISHLNMEAGEIFVLNQTTNIFELAMHRGVAAEAFWTRNKFAVGDGIIGQVGQTGRSVTGFDLEKDEKFLHSAIITAGFRQIAAFPLMSRGRVIGVLAVFTQSTTQITDRDQRIITSICNWAGITLENTQFQVDRRRFAVLEERDRIGMDLHDGIIQEIYGVGLMLERANLELREDPVNATTRIQGAISGLNRTIRDIRSYILDLKPRELGDENLFDGLRRLVTEFKVNTLSEATLIGHARDLDALPQRSAMALFLICQEGLSNIAKHARAKKVDVHVWTTNDRVILEIADNGQGFNLEKMSQNIGHGLANMQTRARQVGGEFEITSNPNEGTSILAWVPLGSSE